MDSTLGTKKFRDPTTGKYYRNLPNPPQDPNAMPSLHSPTMAWNLPASHLYNIEFCKLIANAAIRQEGSLFVVADFEALAQMSYTYSLNLRRVWIKIVKPPTNDAVTALEKATSSNTRKNTVSTSRTRLATLLTCHPVL